MNPLSNEYIIILIRKDEEEQKSYVGMIIGGPDLVFRKIELMYSIEDSVSINFR